MTSELWYEKPAKVWTEALPLGNGRIGAMLYSEVYDERIGLNEDTLWSGYIDRRKVEDKSSVFRQIQKAVRDNNLSEAERLFEKDFSGDFSEAYMPLGEMRIRYILPEGEVSNYRRALDIESAIHSASFDIGSAHYRRSSFISNPDQVLIYKVSCSEQSFGIQVSLNSELRHGVQTEGGCLVMRGLTPSHAEPEYCHSEPSIFYDEDHPGVAFSSVLAAETDGKVSSTDASLRIDGANSVILVFSVKSNFACVAEADKRESKDIDDEVKNTVKNAISLGYKQVRARHISDYRKYYQRTGFNLDIEGLECLPTDERIRKADLKLAESLFNYGKYLMISGSRKGSQAMGLQGIWNNSMLPPWSGNYTTNINTQMNYWPALPCGLEECQDPLDDLILRLSITSEKIAEKYYGARGFVVHHNSDIWGFSEPVGRGNEGCAEYAFWPLGSGWLCRHLFDRFEYTKDEEYLRNTAIPIMHKAIEFYEDVCVADEEFTLLGSTSPENRFEYKGKVLAVSKTNTMSIAIIKELYTNYLKAAELLGIKSDFEARVAEHLKKLPDFRISSDGRLLEWDREYQEHDKQHRHVSHLYPLYPASLIDYDKDPLLREACRKSLLVRGDVSTGWSTAWKLCLWARLRDGEHCFGLIKQLLSLKTEDGKRDHCGGVYPNLFDAHPPFQIDGNFGYVAAVIEMLLQGDGQKIIVLPALPKLWKNGSIKGVRLRGALSSDLVWENNELNVLKLYGKAKAISIVYDGKIINRTFDGMICISKGDFDAK